MAWLAAELIFKVLEFGAVLAPTIVRYLARAPYSRALAPATEPAH
jgi:hypothetical protein